MSIGPQPWLKDSLAKIETPFDGDLWNRKELADRLEDYVSRLNVGATIALDAEWGAGKSWFVRNWHAQLEKNGSKVVYLNAFNQDYIDDPFLTISMEIANCIKNEESNFKNIKEVIGNTYRAILPSLPMLLWTLTTSLAGMGLFAKQVADVIDNVKNSGELSEKAGELLNEKLKEHLSGQVENYENEKKSLEYFKTQLTEITKEFDKPLVFIVDELDRCKPEFAIRLIERVKHFFDIPNVVFVLAINKNQLEESINHYYGFDSSANYLEKFIDFSIKLKNQDLTGEKYGEILKKYDSDLGLNLEHTLENYVVISKVYAPNPRQLVRVINKFSLLKFDLDEYQSFFLFIVLIYNELGLNISNEKEFIDDFMKMHNDFYNEEMKNFQPHQTRYKQIFYYLRQYVYNKGYVCSSLLTYLQEEDFEKDNYYKSEIVKYYYSNNQPNIWKSDLIDDWQKYIYMIP